MSDLSLQSSSLNNSEISNTSEAPVVSVISDLLVMGCDALAALVRIGSSNGDPLLFVSNATDRFTVSQMLKQVQS